MHHLASPPIKSPQVGESHHAYLISLSLQPPNEAFGPHPIYLTQLPTQLPTHRALNLKKKKKKKKKK